jgi:chromosome segregation ATPase
MNGNDLIIVGQDNVSLAETAGRLKQSALARASVIETVINPEQQKLAVSVQTEIKSLMGDIEKARKATKEPFLEMGRRIDATAAAFTGALKKEHDRVSDLVSDFQVREQQRVQAELRRMAEEQARIEREKAEANAKAEREAFEAAAKAREAEQAARRAAEREQDEARRKNMQAAADAKAAEIAEIQAKLAAERQRQDELAVQQKEALGPAPEAARVSGQSVKTVWKITKIEPWKLIKARPDLIREIVPDLVAIKAELAQGVKIPGIDAREEIVSGTRGTAALVLDV